MNLLWFGRKCNQLGLDGEREHACESAFNFQTTGDLPMFPLAIQLARISAQM